MLPVVVVFPPGAGGNHLVNMLRKDIDRDACFMLYQNHTPWVHVQVGNNFQPDRLINNGVTLGHFGEIMSHQDLIRSIRDRVRLIILSPETQADIEALYTRRIKLKSDTPSLVGTYFDGEQVFLYEHFMYHYYFGISVDNIMNISICDWFKLDITDELTRMEYFLQTELDKEFCLRLHRLWYQKNFT